MKKTAFVAMSIDGFIAGKDGSLDWLDNANKGLPQGEDCGYKAFIDTVDTIVMGRNTFEKILSFGIEWPYADKSVIVMSSRHVEIPKKIAQTVNHSNKTPAELIAELKAQGVSHIYVDGAKTVQGFMREGLIDDLVLTVVPVLIGTGISFFDDLNKQVSLRHMASEVFAGGYVQLRYALN